MSYNAYMSTGLTSLENEIGAVLVPSVEEAVAIDTTADPIGEVNIGGIPFPISPDGSITVDGQTVPLNPDLTYTLPDGTVATPTFDLSKYPEEALNDLAKTVNNYISNYYSITNSNTSEDVVDPSIPADPAVPFDPSSIIQAIRDQTTTMSLNNSSILKKLGDILDSLKKLSLIDKTIFDVSKWGDLVAKLQAKIGWVQFSNLVYSIGNDVFGARVFNLQNADISPSFNNGVNSDGTPNPSPPSNPNILQYEINGQSYTTTLPSLTFTYGGHTYNLLECLDAFTSYLPIFKDFIRLIVVASFALSVWRSLPSIIGGVSDVFGLSSSIPVNEDAKYFHHIPDYFSKY